MNFFGYLFRTSKLNADPIQQTLAQLIIDAAEGRKHPAQIIGFLDSQGWSRSDKGNHLTHAASLTKVWRADLYPVVKEMCRRIYVDYL